jgi:SulP family sulfate permease
LIDLTDARFIGITSTIAIEDIIMSYQSQGQEVLLSSVCDRVKNDFDKLKLLEKVPQTNIFNTRLDALNYLKQKL